MVHDVVHVEVQNTALPDAHGHTVEQATSRYTANLQGGTSSRAACPGTHIEPTHTQAIYSQTTVTIVVAGIPIKKTGTLRAPSGVLPETVPHTVRPASSAPRLKSFR